MDFRIEFKSGICFYGGTHPLKGTFLAFNAPAIGSVHSLTSVSAGKTQKSEICNTAKRWRFGLWLRGIVPCASALDPNSPPKCITKLATLGSIFPQFRKGFRVLTIHRHTLVKGAYDKVFAVFD